MAVLADTRIGTELAGYRIEVLLGRGGMSVVYRADHLRLKRKVALKLLAPELAEDERFRERFLRESELAASLDHPNIVPIYDAGEVEGLLYIAMRYVEGTDLKALLRREGALPPARALPLVEQIGSALDAAHERGLVHRDVKPSNVLITGQAGREHCYLADFGLTKSTSDRSGLTDSGQIVGTIDYVAPEQIQGGAVDGRADIYSLACLLYECLTGEVPYGRSSEVAVIYAHLEDSPPRASERRPDLPAALDAVLARGMAKLPEKRYETSAELVAAAHAALPDGAASSPSPARSRRLVVPLAVAAAVAVGAAALAILLARGGGTPIARADSVVRIDPAGGRATPAAKLSGQPTAVTVCAGSVWVTSVNGVVSEIDPKSLTVNPIHVPGTLEDVADVGTLAAVVTGPPRDTVTLIDAAFGGISDVVFLPGAPSASAAAVASGTSIWIANPNAHELDRLDPPYTYIAGATPLPRAAGPMGIAAGEGAVWVAGGRTLWRVNPASGRLAAAIRLPFASHDVAAGEGAVWIVDRRGGAVVRFDPATNRLGTRIPVGRGPSGIAAGSGAVWVANERDGTVSRIDPRRNAVGRTIAVGSNPLDLAVGLGAVWVVRRTD